MTDFELKGYESLYKELQKLAIRVSEKAKKEREKAEQKYILFKGFECYTENDILDVYACDYCTSNEADKARKKLEKLLNADSNGDTKSEAYLKIIELYKTDVAEEIRQEKFRRLPPEESRKILEKNLQILQKRNERI